MARRGPILVFLSLTLSPPMILTIFWVSATTSLQVIPRTVSTALIALLSANFQLRESYPCLPCVYGLVKRHTHKQDEITHPMLPPYLLSFFFLYTHNTPEVHILLFSPLQDITGQTSMSCFPLSLSIDLKALQNSWIKNEIRFAEQFHKGDRWAKPWL